jgi:SAM-dependent methyltransferase
LRALPNLDYVSGDLVHAADVRMDITRLPFGAACFDVAYCSHVLNMLPEDVPALAELARVLVPGGYALLQVPQPVDGEGIELPVSADRTVRLSTFGDPDMYRRYGRDALLRRLAAAGFVTEVVAYASRFEPVEARRLGLIDEDLFVCRKP